MTLMNDYDVLKINNISIEMHSCKRTNNASNVKQCWQIGGFILTYFICNNSVIEKLLQGIYYK